MLKGFVCVERQGSPKVFTFRDTHGSTLDMTVFHLADPLHNVLKQAS